MPAEPASVVLVSSPVTWRGGEAQLLHLARGIQQSGRRVVLAARHGSEVATRFLDAGVETRELPGKPRSPRFLLALRRLLLAVRARCDS